MVFLCRLVGHRRDKRRVRSFKAKWHSKCVRCDAPMVRSATGKWAAVGPHITKAMFIRPDQQATGDPFAAAPVGGEPRQPLAVRTAVRAPTRVRSGDADQRDYYVVRADEARAMAEAAPDPRIKLIHLEMAARYYALANHHLDHAPLERTASLTIVGESLAQLG